MWWLTSVISAIWKVAIKRILVWGQPSSKSTRPYLKINYSKRGLGAQLEWWGACLARVRSWVLREWERGRSVGLHHEQRTFRDLHVSIRLWSMRCSHSLRASCSHDTSAAPLGLCCVAHRQLHPHIMEQGLVVPQRRGACLTPRTKGMLCVDKWPSSSGQLQIVRSSQPRQPQWIAGWHGENECVIAEHATAHPKHSGLTAARSRCLKGGAGRRGMLPEFSFCVICLE
jgi:hypothetical protein